MTDVAERLIAQYRGRGVIIANRLQLKKDDALELADNLRAIDIGILGLELWYPSESTEGKFVEYIWSPDYSGLKEDSDFVEKSVSKAKEYILNELPDNVSLIGVVF